MVRGGGGVVAGIINACSRRLRSATSSSCLSDINDRSTSWLSSSVTLVISLVMLAFIAPLLLRRTAKFTVDMFECRIFCGKTGDSLQCKIVGRCGNSLKTVSQTVESLPC